MTPSREEHNIISVPSPVHFDQCCGSMTFWGGSGSVSGSWIRILLFSSLTFKMPAKNLFFNTIFLLITFWKIKNKKESQNRRNQSYSYYFCMMIEGSGSGSRAGSGSGSIPLTSGSGSRRPKNMWIQWIQIRNTDFDTVSTDFLVIWWKVTLADFLAFILFRAFFIDYIFM